MSTPTIADDFTQSMDARVWAAEFVKLAREREGFATDEGNMIGWFANAIMRGHDTAHWMAEKKLEQAVRWCFDNPPTQRFENRDRFSDNWDAEAESVEQYLARCKSSGGGDGTP